MAETKKGNVARGSGNGKNFNGKTYYSFQLDGEWFRTGLKDPKVNEGDLVQFEYTVDPKYGNQVDMKTFNAKRGEAPKVSQGTSAKKSGGPPKEDYVARDKYWAQKEVNDIIRQNTISYQAATNTAIDLIKVAIEEDMLTIPGKKADKLDRLYDIVTDTADKLYGAYLRADDRAEDLKKGVVLPAGDEDAEVPVDDTPPPAEEPDEFDDDVDDVEWD